MLVTILTVIFVITAVWLIFIILLQIGKGGGLAAAFGSSVTEALWGPRRGNILTRITAITGGVFMLTSLLLALTLPSSVSIVKRHGVVKGERPVRVEIPGIEGGTPTSSTQLGTPSTSLKGTPTPST
jgi:preprotein translocase subunit SecG